MESDSNKVLFRNSSHFELSTDLDQDRNQLIVE